MHRPVPTAEADVAKSETDGQGAGLGVRAEPAMTLGAVGLLALGCQLERDDPRDRAASDWSEDGRAPLTDGVSIGIGSARARFVATVADLRNPESVRWTLDLPIRSP